MKGLLYVLVSAVMFATNAVWIKLAYGAGITLWQLLTLQSIIASCFLVAIAVVTNPASLKVSLKQLGQITVQGIVGMLLTGIFFTAALLYISAALSTVLLYTYPAMVAMVSALFLGKSLSLRHLFAIALTLAGTMLAVNIFTPDNMGELNRLGIGLAVAAALTYTFFNIYGEYILEKISPLTVTVYAQLSSTLVLVSFTLPAKVFASGITWEMVYLSFLLAILASVAPFFLVLKGIQLIGSNKASVVSTFELPATLMLAYFVLAEQILPVQLAGSALILSGIFLVKLQASPSPTKAKNL